MSFMPTGAPGIGNAMVRVGADFRGMSASTSKAMTQFRGQMAAGTQGLGTANKQAAALGNNMDTAAKKASKLGLAIRGMAIGLGAVGIGMGVMAIKAAMDFESAFAGVKKTVDASEQDLEKLRQSFLDLAEAIPVSASQLARVGEAAGALGIPTKSILQFTKVVSTIGTTTDVSTEEAATALGQLSNVLNMTSDDYERFASTLVDLGNKGASTESQIIEITRRMGSAAKLFGISTDQILALGSSAANLGMQPQLAASSLQRLIMRLVSVSGGMSSVDEITSKAGISIADFTKIVQEGGDKLDKFADTTGFSSKELTKIQAGLESLDALKMALGLTQQQFEKLQRAHPEQIIEGMFRAMRDMDAGERQLFIQRIMGPAASAGGGVGLQQLMLGLADSVDRNLTPSLRNASAAWAVNNAAMVEAEKRYATTSSQLQQLQNTFTGVLIEAGTGSLPMVAEVLGKIRAAIPNIADAIGNAWDVVQGPMQQVGDAAFRLGNILQDIVLEWGGGGSAEGLLGSLDVMATLTETIAHWLTSILDTTGQILSVPAINALAKMAMLWGAVAIAFKGMMGLRNFFTGAAMGVGGLLGAPARSLANSISPADKMQMEAAALQQKAAATNMAAATKEAVTPSMVGMPGAGPFALPMAQTGASAAAATAAMNARAAAMGAGAMGLGISRAQQMRDMAAKGLRGASGMLSSGMGLVSRAFWPLFIADLVGNLVAAPIGDFIAKSTGMKRLGEAWGRGWLEGITASVQAYTQGTDAFVGRPGEYELPGGQNVATDVLQRLSANTGAELTELTGLLDRLENPVSEVDAAAAQTELTKWLQARESLAGALNADLETIREAAGGRIEALEFLSGLFGWGMEIDALKALDMPDTGKAEEAGREMLQDLVIKAFRAAGLDDIPGSLIATMSSDRIVKMLAGIEATPTDAPAGISALIASYWSRQDVRGATGDPLEDLKEGIKGVRTEIEGVKQAVATVDPAHLAPLRDIFSPDTLAGIEGAGTRAQKAAIIRRMDEMWDIFKGEDVSKLTGKQKKRVDDKWSQLLEYAGYAMGTLGLSGFQTAANKAKGMLTDAMTTSLLSGEVIPVEALIGSLGASLEDGVGDDDFITRASDSISDMLVKAVKRTGDSPEGKAKLRKAFSTMFASAGPEMLQGMNLADVILAANAPKLRGKTREEQSDVLKRMRRLYGDDLVPKNVGELRRKLNLPKGAVKQWETYFATLKTASNEPYWDTLPQHIKDLTLAMTDNTPALQTAAEGIEEAVAAPVENLLTRVNTAVDGVATKLAQLVLLQSVADAWAGVPEPDSGSGGGSGRGGGGGGRRRRPTRERVAPRIRGRSSRRGAPSGTRPVSANLGGSVSQTINVDRLELHSDSQRQSALESLSFLAPLG